MSRPGDMDALGKLRIEDSPLGATLREQLMFDRENTLAREVLRLRTLLPEACPSCHGTATVANMPCPVCLLGRLLGTSLSSAHAVFAEKLAHMVEATDPADQGILLRAIEREFN